MIKLTLTDSSGNGLAVFNFSKLTVFEVIVPVSKHYLAFADPVTDPVRMLLHLLSAGEFSSGEMRERLGVTHRANFRDNYIHPAISLGLIIQTIPEKPNSRLQKYKLTDRAKNYLQKINSKDIRTK